MSFRKKRSKEQDPGAASPEPPSDPPAEGGEAADHPEQPDELAALRASVEELTDKHLRAVAELQNFRRRATAEKDEAVQYASAGLARAVLPVVDDFERMLASAREGEASSLLEGVRLIHQNLLKALEAHHVQRIESAGRPFDPTCHEAMMQQPTTEHPPGTVLEEYQPGYKLWDRVLRPAKVIVSQAAAEPDSNEEPPDETSPAAGPRGDGEQT